MLARSFMEKNDSLAIEFKNIGVTLKDFENIIWKDESSRRKMKSESNFERIYHKVAKNKEIKFWKFWKYRKLRKNALLKILSEKNA